MLENQPDETNDLKALAKEFIDRMTVIDNEIQTLKDDKKELIEEYKDKLDIKTLNAALKVIKIQNSVEHKDTFDTFVEVLQFA
jgi:uncharacterized protein (UPF0335 family)